MNAEAWATITVGILTIFAQLLFVVLAYIFGRSQGKSQTQHEKAAGAIVDAVRLTRQVAAECYAWSRLTKRDEIELRHRVEVTRLRGELLDLVNDNSPWFEPQTEGKLRPVIEDLKKVTIDHITALKSDNEAQVRESGERLSEWIETDLAQMQMDMENEARRIIGTKRQ